MISTGSVNEKRCLLFAARFRCWDFFIQSLFIQSSSLQEFSTCATASPWILVNWCGNGGKWHRSFLVLPTFGGKH